MASRDVGRLEAIREFLSGVALVGRGLRVWRTAPHLMVVGLIPAVIVGVFSLAGIIALALNLDAIALAATPFAADWDEPFRSGIRIVVGLAFLAVAVLVIVFTFTAVTLIVGGPFYERIWRHVELQYGPVPDDGPRGFWAPLTKGILDGIRMLVPTLLIGVGVLAVGLIPGIGTILAGLLGAVVGGWFLTVELVGFAFDARGRTLHERRQALRARRPLALGFGVAMYLLFLIPLGAVLMMPAAVAGASVLARRTLGESEIVVSP